MAEIPVHEWTLIDAARAVRDKEISSRELTRALLSRIERLNPKINSYITVLPEHAMRDAAARDEELSRGRAGWGAPGTVPPGDSRTSSARRGPAPPAAAASCPTSTRRTTPP